MFLPELNPEIWDERPMSVQIKEERELYFGTGKSKRAKLTSEEKLLRKKQREQKYYQRNRVKIIERVQKRTNTKNEQEE